MKFKQDFVTNSSSSCFVLAVSPEQLEGVRETVAELDRHPDAGNEGVRIYDVFDDLKELDEYTNDGPLDWAQKPRGPQFNNLGQSTYEACREVILENKIAVYMAVDYNVVEQFQTKWDDVILECIY